MRPSKDRRKQYEYALERERAAGRPPLVDPAATLRKVQALAWMGWTMSDIAGSWGTTRNSLCKSLRHRRRITRFTAERVNAFYVSHHMLTPAWTPNTARSRARAVRMGFKPSLHWEDIDAGVPYGKAPVDLDFLDGAEVEYALQYHDFSRKLSPAEKTEIIRRWVANGRSKASLERLSGWNTNRYQEAS